MEPLVYIQPHFADCQARRPATEVSRLIHNQRGVDFTDRQRRDTSCLSSEELTDLLARVSDSRVSFFLSQTAYFGDVGEIMGRKYLLKFSVFPCVGTVISCTSITVINDLRRCHDMYCFRKWTLKDYLSTSTYIHSHTVGHKY